MFSHSSPFVAVTSWIVQLLNLGGRMLLQSLVLRPFQEAADSSSSLLGDHYYLQSQHDRQKAKGMIPNMCALHLLG